MKRSRLFVLALALAATGCASANGDRVRTDRNQLTAEEIQSRQFSTAYDAVQALRSNWLRARVQDGTSADVVVYVDGTRAGGTSFLRQIDASTVFSIRYLSASEASTRFGRGHSGGVIQVTTRDR